MVFLRFYQSLFFRNRLYLSLGIVLLVCITGFFFPAVYTAAKIGFAVWVALFLLDIAMMYLPGKAIQAERIVGERFSNGDENPVSYRISSRYTFPVHGELMDELPFQFQRRDFTVPFKLKGGGETRLNLPSGRWIEGPMPSGICMYTPPAPLVSYAGGSQFPSRKR